MRRIRLTESVLCRLIAESVRRILNEDDDPYSIVKYNVTLEYADYFGDEDGECESENESSTETFDNEDEAIEFVEELVSKNPYFRDGGYAHKLLSVVLTKDTEDTDNHFESYTNTILAYENQNDEMVQVFP